MHETLRLTLLCGAILAPITAAEEAAAPPAGLASITQEELYDHVATLADDLLGGRRPGTAEHELVRKSIAKSLEELGLEPAGDEGSFFQEVKSTSRRRRSSVVAGFNVLGLLPGADEELAGEIVIVSAHYDHLGTKDGQVFNGADDNASGVAALLELAEAFAGLEGEARPRRSMLFAAWDLEEVGLAGSNHWVENPTRPLADVVFMISMDMLSRHFMGILEEEAFVLGTEHSNQIAAVVGEVDPPAGLEILVVGSDLVGSRSDHWAFMLAGVPYLFFTTGTQKTYHTPEDVAETIDRAKLERCTRYIYELLSRVALADERPTFNDPPVRTTRELEYVLAVLDQIEEGRDHFAAVEGLFEQLADLRAQVDAIRETGSVTEEQREVLKVAAATLVLRLKEE